MLLAFLSVEGLFIGIFFFIAFIRFKKTAKSAAAALVSSLFLSGAALIMTGLVSRINLGLYLIFKTGLTALWAAVFMPKNTPHFKKDLHEILLRLKEYARSPVGMASCLLLVFLFLASARSYPVRYDSYSYHLPVAADLLKNGILDHYQYYGVSIGSYYPHMIQILYSLYFSINGIEGSSLMNFPAVLLLFLAVYLLSHETLGCRKNSSILGALVFLFMPLVSRFFFEAYVDLYFCAFVLLSIYFLHRFVKSKSLYDLVVIILLMGLIMGTKYQGLPYAGILGLAALIFVIKYRGRKYMRSSTVAAAAAAVSVGCFFYLRNFILTGNPVFPLALKLGKVFSFPGFFSPGSISRTTSIVHNFPVIRESIIPTVYSELSFSLIAFLLLGLVPFAFIKRKSLLRISWLMAGIGMLLGASFLTSPLSALTSARGINFSLRLGLPFVAALFLFLLAWAQNIPDRILIPVLAFPLAALVFFPFKQHPAAMIAACALALLVRFTPRFRHLKTILCGFSVVFILAWAVDSPMKRHWHNLFSGLSGRQSLNIAYAGTNRHFQLYDGSLKYNLFYINVDRKQNLKWNRETNPTYQTHYRKKEGNFRIWLENLQEKKIDFLVLMDVHVSYIENTWVRRNPDLFHRETDNIFRVNQAELAKRRKKQRVPPKKKRLSAL